MRDKIYDMKVEDHIIPQVTRFKYFWSIIQNDGKIEGMQIIKFKLNE